MRLDDLPIFPLLPDISRALRAGSLVLSAETGAGKTSAVPAYLVETKALAGKALILEPRRLAAIAAASRVSELLGTELGRTVGYRVRGDSRAGRDTMVVFITEAVFIRMVQDDPFLSGVSLVAFDEFHERSAACDLGLAFADEARAARDGLSILAMSATMDSTAVSTYLGCPAINSPGRLYPIETAYRPPRNGAFPEAAVVEAILEAFGSTSGDVLAFLPGLREIGAATALLSARSSGMDILPLHGSLSLREQKSVLAPTPGAKRRVIMATSVAETSLTVPRISAVVDSGLSRFIRFHAPSGLNRLVTERVSAAEAGQRRGRAGRLGPGLCLRCWNEADLLAPSRGTELERIELSGVVLECAVRGAGTLESVHWLDPPPRHAWDAAVAVLRSIGLVDETGRSTESGRRAARLGADPRAAAALLTAEAAGATDTTGTTDPTGSELVNLQVAALAAAAMTEREASAADGDFGSSLERMLAAAGRSGYGDPRASRILEEAGRLLSRVSGSVHGHHEKSIFNPAAAAAGIAAVGNVLAPGFPDRLARRLADDTWEFSTGRRARASFAPPRAKWLLAVDVDAGDPLGRIRSGAPVEAAAARAALLPGAVQVLEVEWRGLSAAAWVRTKAGTMTLGERRLDRVPANSLAAAFASRLRDEGLSWLPWSDDARSLVDRTRFVASRSHTGTRIVAKAGNGTRALTPEGLADAALIELMASTAADWLSPSGAVIDEPGMEALLAYILGREVVAEVDAAAPAFITTPGGRRRRPIYPAAGPARLAARIQEFFGMARSPRACGEPMTLELLSPADRPLQVTNDLESFWSTTYPAIRAELARRYPKHYWPLDPLVAEPTRGPRPKPRN